MQARERPHKNPGFVRCLVVVVAMVFIVVRMRLKVCAFPTTSSSVVLPQPASVTRQAIPGYILLLMPVVYGLTGQPPFNTDITSYFSCKSPSGI